jgi:hypothetical protein
MAWRGMATQTQMPPLRAPGDACTPVPHASLPPIHGAHGMVPAAAAVARGLSVAGVFAHTAASATADPAP